MCYVVERLDNDVIGPIWFKGSPDHLSVLRTPYVRTYRDATTTTAVIRIMQQHLAMLQSGSELNRSRTEQY